MPWAALGSGGAQVLTDLKGTHGCRHAAEQSSSKQLHFSAEGQYPSVQVSSPLRIPVLSWVLSLV